MIPIYFNEQSKKYEEWFCDVYLKALGLSNKQIDGFPSDEMEGHIESKDKKIALFELKLLSFGNIQADTKQKIKDLSKADGQYCHELPNQEKTLKSVRDRLEVGINQLLNKKPEENISRILFLVINDAADITSRQIISAVKSGRSSLFDEKGEMVVVDNCDVFDEGNNKSVLDLFYSDKISGIVMLFAGTKKDFSVIAIKNKIATIEIPDLFYKGYSPDFLTDDNEIMV